MKSSNWSLAALAGALFLLLVAFSGEATPGYDRFAFPKEGLAVLLGGTVALWQILATGQLLVDRLDRIVAATVILALIGSVRADNLWYAERAVAVAAAGFFFFLAVRAARPSVGTIARAAAAIGTFLAVIVMLEAWGLLPHLSLQGRAPGGTLGNRNYAAQVFLLAAPAAGLALIRASTRVSRMVWTGALALLGAGIVVCRSRGVWLASGATLIFLSTITFWRRSHATRLWPRFGIGALLAVALGTVTSRQLWPGESPLLSTLGRLTEHDIGTGRSRVTQFRNGLRMVADHPLFGVGPGNWSMAYPRYVASDDPDFRADSSQPLSRLPNSDWLGFIAERGIVGLLAMIVLGLEVIRLLHRDWNTESDGKARAIVVGATSVAVLVMGLFDCLLLRPETLCLVAFVFGTLPRVGSPPVPRDPTLRILIAPFLLLLWIPCLVLAIRRCEAGALRSSSQIDDWRRSARLDRGDYIITGMLAARLANEGECPEALLFAKRTIELFPHSKLARDVAARCAPAESVGQVTTKKSIDRQGRILRWLSIEQSKLVSVSPDGTRVVTKTQDGDNSTLSVKTLDTSTVIDQITSAPQFLITWAPNAREIALVTKPDAAVYEYPLYHWILGAGALRKIDAPVSENAMHLMRWSRDSSRLAYYRHESPDPTKGNNLEIVDFPSGRARNLIGVHEPHDFDWSPRGPSIAISAPLWSGFVTLVDTRNGRQTLLQLPNSQYELRHFCFQPDGKGLIAAVRGPHDDFFGLARIDLASRKVETLARPKADVVHPHCLDDGRIVVQLDEDASLHLATFSREAGLVPFGPRHGTASFQTATLQGPVLLQESVDADQRVIRMRWSGETTAEFGEPAARPVPGESVVEFLHVPGDDGHETPIILRKPMTGRPARCAIVQAAGDRYTLRPTGIARFAQALAAEDCYFVAANVRGIPGFGRHNEEFTNPELAARDLVAVGRFMQRTCGLPRSAVVAYGLSDGAATALRALSLDPSAFGGAMLVALLQTLPVPIDARTADIRVLLLYPQLDNKVTEAESKDLFGRAFQGGIDGTLVRWEMLADEGHIPTKPESFGRIGDSAISLSER